MASIVTDIDIARPADEVFSYVTDPSRFAEWQAGVVSGHTAGDGPPAVGTRCTMTRRIGGSERTTTSEITQIDPPRTWAIRGKRHLRAARSSSSAWKAPGNAPFRRWTMEKIKLS